MPNIQKEVEEYLLEGEEVSYSFIHRPTGFLSWLKSLVGYGDSHWYVTNDRLIVYRRVAGGFEFQEVPLNNITSVKYGRNLDLALLAFGIVTIPFLIGILIVLYALFHRQQVLELYVSGGADLSVAITSGTDIDEFLWYLPTQRKMSEINPSK